MRDTPRLRRLRSDFRSMQQLVRESSILEFSYRSAGPDDPPDAYSLRFQGRGIRRHETSGQILVQTTHEVSVELGAGYPRQMPSLGWKSPVFHPNISASGVVCLGGYGAHWVPSLTLPELCRMLWDMIRYANYDVESPYNRDAAVWARNQRDWKFPMDPRPLRDRIIAGETIAPAARRGPAEEEVVFLDSVRDVRGKPPVADAARSDPDIMFIE